MAKLVLDLHDVFQNGKAISESIGQIIDEAIHKKITLIEIIHGKGSGQLKRRVLKFLDQSHIKAKYKRIEKDTTNHGRLFINL